MSNAIVRMNPATLPDAGKVGYSQISIANPGRLAFISDLPYRKRLRGKPVRSYQILRKPCAPSVRHRVILSRCAST